MSIAEQTASASPVIVNDAAIIWLNNDEMPDKLFLTLWYYVVHKFENFTSDTFDACLSYTNKSTDTGNPTYTYRT